MKRHIPNCITSLNLISGCIATTMAFNGELLLAALFILFAAIFDFFDGFTARLLKVTSAIGHDLDSLADLISFGLAPSVIVMSLLKDCTYPEWMGAAASYVPYLAFLMTAASALRLAKFNNDERQHTSFIGLPTPANAMFFAGLANIPIASFCWQPLNINLNFTGSWAVLILLMLVFSYLLVSELPMFALKVKGKTQMIFAPLAFILIAGCGFLGISLTIVIYLLIAAVQYATKK